MKRWFTYILLACLSGLITLVPSCTETIDIDLKDSEPRIVVEAMLVNLTQFMEVKLHYTSSYFSNTTPKGVTGAEVSLDDGVEIVPFVESDTGSYLSQYPVLGLPGRTYTLAIRHEGKEYSATATMPQTPVIDSIKAYRSGSASEWKNISLGVYAWDPPEPGNYYLFRAYVNNILDTDTITEAVITTDKLINGNNFGGVIVQNVRARHGDVVSLVMASITKEYYQYLYALFKETMYNNGPFEAAPASIPSNFTGGAHGFFTVQSRDVATRTISLVE